MFMLSGSDSGASTSPVIIITGENYLSLFPEDTQITPPTFYRERLHAITWSMTSAGRAPPTVLA